MTFSINQTAAMMNTEKDRYKVPALCLTGGELPANDCLRYRVWVHPAPSGSDYYYEFSTLSEARSHRSAIANNNRKLEKKGRPKFNKVEQILGVVWDNQSCNFREVRIKGLRYG